MNNNYKILVIDDDTRLRNLLGKFLNDNGFEVDLAKDTIEAREILQKKEFNLLIVDVMMPVENGIEFTKNIRKNSNIPVIMLTARGEPDDRVVGLEVGADDYMQKPFEPRELLLRINNIIKRFILNNENKITPNILKNEIEDKVKFGNYTFYPSQLRLKKVDDFVHITENEAKILKILAQNQGKAVARNTLSEMLGGIDERSIDVSITRLRRKIENNPKQPNYLQTIRNFGYILYD
jgi:two-component system phosphate regulon response regulator OmpR